MLTKLDHAGAWLSKRPNQIAVFIGLWLAHVAFHLGFGATVKPYADEAMYWGLATNWVRDGLLHYGGYYISDFMPGYPALMRLIFEIFGVNRWSIYLVQDAMQVTSAFVLFAAVKRGYSQAAAFVTFVLFAFYPAGFVYPGTSTGETLIILLASTLVWLSTAPTYRPLRLGLLAGLTLGIAAITKPEYIFWSPGIFLLGARDIANRTWRNRALATAVTMATMACVLLPWNLRNREVFGESIWLSTAGGRTWWLSAHKPFLTEFTQPPFEVALRECARKVGREGLSNLRCEADPNPHDAVTCVWGPMEEHNGRMCQRCDIETKPALMDACLKKAAVAMILEHPGYTFGAMFRRIPMLFIGSHTESLFGFHDSFGNYIAGKVWDRVALKLTFLGWHSALVISGLLAWAWLVIKQQRFDWGYWVAIKIALHLFIMSTPRYSLHLYPMLLSAAGVAAVYFAQKKSPAAVP